MKKPPPEGKFVNFGASDRDDGAVRAATTLLDIMLAQATERGTERHHVRQLALTVSMQLLFNIAEERLADEVLTEEDRALSEQELFACWGVGLAAVAWQAEDPELFVHVALDALKTTMAGLTAQKGKQP